MDTETSQTYRAAYIFPVEQPPIANGVVEVALGKVVAVRSYRAGDVVTDLGDVAILPGLVNAHTHLEFSELSSPLGDAETSFPDWIRLVIGHRRQLEETIAPDAWRSAGVDRGLRESEAAGVTVLGEIATPPWPQQHFQASKIASISFLELLGLSPERIEPLWQMAQQHIEGSSSALRGLSPHAPYTVHPELFARACVYSSEKQFPIAFHLAETLAEIELLQSGSGRLVEMLESLGAMPRAVIPRGSRPMNYLEHLSYAHRSLVVHGNFLSDDEVAYVGERSDRMSVVYCPRTHRHFNRGRYPLAEMLEANVNICLGTDSRASNPDLNLWEEMRFVAANHPQVSLEGVLHLGTQSGADALGLGDQFGSVTAGKRAALVTIPIQPATVDEPHELLFANLVVATPL